MKTSANSIRPGMVLLYKDKLWKVIKTQHTQPGKGGAYVQMELKSLMDNTKLHERFRSSEDLMRAIMDERKCQYLYATGNEYIFMDLVSFEQISITEDILGEDSKLLSENLEVIISLYNDQPIAVILPKTVVLEVIETEAEVKGQTVSGSFKPALVSNNIRVMVPTHINPGTKIIINTEDLSYSGKIK